MRTQTQDGSLTGFVQHSLEKTVWVLQLVKQFVLKWPSWDRKKVMAIHWWKLLKEAVAGFFNDGVLSHAAAIAFYATTSLAPVLLIVVAIAGLAFGNDAAQLALTAQVSGLMGSQSAALFEATLKSASGQSAGVIATLIGLFMLLVTASGVFGEMQLSLNKIWKVESQRASTSTLMRARVASLGLVAALGFLLIISLAASAALAALGKFIGATVPFGIMILTIINASISFLLLSILFAAIFKVLPDRRLAWRDVAIGAITTAGLFTAGKTLIGWYLGSSAIATTYGAAGGLMIVLLWVFYSSVIFLFGAELTRAYSIRNGTRADLSSKV